MDCEDAYSAAASSSSSSSSTSNLHSPHVPLEVHVQTSTHKKKAGRKKFRETRHPVYRGVRQKNGDKWVCEVREPLKKSRIWLGTFPCPEMAARAYDVAALALRGKSAPLNFPDSAWLLPCAKSALAWDIQSAALEAAEAFRPPATSSSPTSLSPSEWLRVKSPEKVTEPMSSSFFFDEEALFNMPGLLDSMAEGLLLTPPAMHKGFYWDDLDHEIDLTLWRA